MNDLKITVNQLKNYMGTGLKVTFDGDEYDHELVGIDLSNEGIHLISVFNDFGRASIKNIRPIVYRISDLDKEIEHNGERFMPAEKLLPHYKKCDYRLSGNILEKLNPKAKNSWGFRYVNIENMKYPDIQKIFEWHFWPFGDTYFEQGLVIDKMKHNNG